MNIEQIEVSLVYKQEEEFFVEKISAVKEDKYYRANSIPAFAQNISFGDLLKVSYEKGEYYFEELIEESGHSTLHIVVFNLNAKTDIIEKLNQLGCGVNDNIAENYLVIDLPPVIPYYEIRTFLNLQAEKGNIDYSEACISKQHKISYS
jgi:hypothetical protein